MADFRTIPELVKASASRFRDRVTIRDGERELSAQGLSAHKVPSAIRLYAELPGTPTARVDKPAPRRQFLVDH